MSIPALILTSQLAREPLPVTGERQVVYVLLEVRAIESATPSHINLGFILDRSSSMRGPRLQALKSAILRVIDQLDEQDYLTVITFDDMVEPVISAQPVTDREALKQTIQLIQEGGGTAMSLGLSLGLAIMRPHCGQEHLSRMILVTDGVTQDVRHCLDLAQEAGSMGIPIAPLGVGAEWDDAFLARIATSSGGPPPAYIRRPAELTPAFEQQVRELRAIALREVEITAHFVTGVTPRQVTRLVPYTLPIDDTIQDNEVNLTIGDIEGQRPHALLFELSIEPKRAGTFRIAQVEARYTGPDGEQISTRGDVVVTFSGSAAKPPRVHPVVVHYVERANAARIVLHALAEGKPTAAAFSPALMALFDNESRDALEHIRAGLPLTPEAHKAVLARIRGLARTRRPSA